MENKGGGKLSKLLLFRCPVVALLLVCSSCGLQPTYEVRYTATEGACYAYEQKYSELEVVRYEQDTKLCLMQTKTE